MPAIEHTSVKISRGCHAWTWTDILKADTPDALGDGDGAVAFADKTVQVGGSFDSTVVTLEGSNDGSTWFGLSDPQGVAISFSAAGLEAILENPRFIKPVLTGGTAPSIDVWIVGRAIIQLF